MKRKLSKLTILFACLAITSTGAMAQKSKKPPLPDTTKVPDTTKIPDTTKVPDTTSAKIRMVQPQNGSVELVSGKPDFNDVNGMYVAIREELETLAAQKVIFETAA